MDVLERIKKQVEGNAVVIYMKGSPNLPSCGFSSRAAEALTACGEEYAHVNILEDPDIFYNLPSFSDWPTFPQIFIDGELVGGCDITVELYQSGELKKMVHAATAKKVEKV